MTARVVHRLEAVQIDEEDRDIAFAPPRLRKGALEAVEEEALVGKRGERIGERHLLQLGLAFLQRDLGHLARGHVEVGARHAQHVPVGRSRAHRAARADPHERAVEAAHAVLHVVEIGLAAQHRAHCGPAFLLLPARDAIDELDDRDEGVAAPRPAHEARPVGAQLDLAGVHVELPCRHARALHREREPVALNLELARELVVASHRLVDALVRVAHHHRAHDPAQAHSEQRRAEAGGNHDGFDEPGTRALEVDIEDHEVHREDRQQRRHDHRKEDACAQLAAARRKGRRKGRLGHEGAAQQ